MKPAKVRVLSAKDFSRRLGVSFVRIERGRVTCSFTAGSEHHNPYGFLHGGVVATLADSAMGVAVASTLRRGERCSTVEYKMNYVEPVREGRLKAEGRVLHRGRRMALTRCEVRDERGRLVALATGSFYIFAGGENG